MIFTSHRYAVAFFLFWSVNIKLFMDEFIKIKTDCLKASGLVKSYNGRKVVDNVSFYINPGEVVALLGPNGAGKTTSFDMVVGLVKPDAGMITLGLEDITKQKIHDRAQMGIGYLTQEPSAFR